MAHLSARALFCGSTALFTVLAIGLAVLCERVDWSILLPLAITFGTIAYHLLHILIDLLHRDLFSYLID